MSMFPDDFEEDFEDALSFPTVIQGKDEMNLAEFPFGILKRQGEGSDVYVYEGSIRSKEGIQIHQRWEVHGLATLGLPTEYDERVLVALMAITALHNFQNRKVPFSVYQVCRLMGVTTSVNDYNNVERALKRMVGVTIFASSAFWDKEENGWLSKVDTGFHILEKFSLRKKKKGQAVVEKDGESSYIIWSSDLWKSLKDGYIKNLDLKFYFSLETPLSRRLYRILDKRMNYKPEYQIDVFDLANRLGMTSYAYPSKVVEKLRPAMEELKARHFLKRYEVIKRGKYVRLYFEREAVQLAETSVAALPSPPDAAPRAQDGAKRVEPLDDQQMVEAEIIHSLMALGYKSRTAKRLASLHTEEYILQKIEYLAFAERTYPKKVRNPLAWLQKALEENYSEPEGFVAYKARQQLLEDMNAGDSGPQLELDLALDTVEGEVSDFVEEGSLDADARDRLWKHILADIELQLTKATFDSLFSRTRLLRVTEELAVIQVPNVMVQEWIEHRQKRLLEQTFYRHYEHPVELEFTVLE